MDGTSYSADRFFALRGLLLALLALAGGLILSLLSAAPASASSPNALEELGGVTEIVEEVPDVVPANASREAERVPVAAERTVAMMEAVAVVADEAVSRTPLEAAAPKVPQPGVVSG